MYKYITAFLLTTLSIHSAFGTQLSEFEKTTHETYELDAFEKFTSPITLMYEKSILRFEKDPLSLVLTVKTDSKEGTDFLKGEIAVKRGFFGEDWSLPIPSDEDPSLSGDIALAKNQESLTCYLNITLSKKDEDFSVVKFLLDKLSSYTKQPITTFYLQSPLFNFVMNKKEFWPNELELLVLKHQFVDNGFVKADKEKLFSGFPYNKNLSLFVKHV